MYRLHITQQGQRAFFTAAQISHSELWHNRLGHPGKDSFQKLIKGNYVRGLPEKLTAPTGVCAGCQMGKQAKNKVPKSATAVARLPLELTHLDLCGPMHVTSLGGARFMMMLVDDATRYKTVYLLKEKSEAVKYLQH